MLARDLLTVVRFEVLILRLQVLQLVPVLLHLVFKGSHTILESNLLSLTGESHINVIIIAHYTTSIKDIEPVPAGTSESPLTLEPFSEAQICQLDYLSAESLVFLLILRV